MPMKPKRACGYPGCPNLTAEYYCPEHAALRAKQYEQNGRQYRSSDRYGRRWRKIRNLYISQHRLCEECLKNGIYTPAQHVHHIKPLAEGGTHDFSNLMSLCISCHDRIEPRNSRS